MLGALRRYWCKQMVFTLTTRKKSINKWKRPAMTVGSRHLLNEHNIKISDEIQSTGGFVVDNTYPRPLDDRRHSVRQRVGVLTHTVVNFRDKNRRDRCSRSWLVIYAPTEPVTTRWPVPFAVHRSKAGGRAYMRSLILCRL